jgi:hypothetical protein
MLLILIPRDTLLKRTFRQVISLRLVSAGSGILTVLLDINHHLETAGPLVGACRLEPS